MRSTSRHKVSVLTPSYNQGVWLTDALASVAAQTYTDIEHVVADGGSTDDSIDRLREFENVIWRTGRDAGQSPALNNAFRCSTGSVIGWLNADDAYFHVEVIERVVEVFEKFPQVDVVYGHAALVNGAGLVLHYIWAPRFSRALLRRFNFIAQPTVFIRRTALEGGTFVDETYDYAMDRELWLRLSDRCCFHRLNDVLAIDRHHASRKSYLRPDVLLSDQAALADAYGIAIPSGLRLWARGLKAVLRLRGAELVLRQTPALAFRGRRDGTLASLHRQVAMRRRGMPLGDVPRT